MLAGICGREASVADGGVTAEGEAVRSGLCCKTEARDGGVGPRDGGVGPGDGPFFIGAEVIVMDEEAYVFP